MRHVGGSRSSSSRGESSQEQQDDDCSRQRAQAAARATALLSPDGGSGDIDGGYYESRGAGGGVQEGESRQSAVAAAGGEAAAAAAESVAVAVVAAAAEAAAGREQGGEGARLHAYQLVSSEPRLLLLRAEPELSGRLRFLLDALPGLRGSWSARLRRAAPLLAIESSALQSRLEGLAGLFPPDADLQVWGGLFLGGQGAGLAEGNARRDRSTLCLISPPDHILELPFASAGGHKHH